MVRVAAGSEIDGLLETGLSEISTKQDRLELNFAREPLPAQRLEKHKRHAVGEVE